MWTFLLDRFRVNMLIIIGVLGFGILSFGFIPRETTPQVDIPAANVATVWPGASPSDVEELITNVIERKIDGLENLEEYNSRSLSGLSIINVEFTTDSDKTDNLNKLREKIDEAKAELPSEVPDDPTVTEVSLSDIPILSLTISGDYAWSELKRFAELVEDEIEAVPLVKSVIVSGAPEDEVHIYLDPLKLRGFGLGVDEVLQALRAANQDLPLGDVKLDGQKVEVSLKAKLKDIPDFLSLPIKKTAIGSVQLQEIASVRREFAEFTVESLYLPFLTENMPENEVLLEETEENTEKKMFVAEKAVSIDVIKSASKGNAITMVEDILQLLEDLKTNSKLPESLEVSVTYNRADEIEESLGVLTNSGSQTLVLIAICMLIALGWRESLLASMAIPLSMLIAITTLYFNGETFNGISLFALVLAVGLLVDNAIIIVEGMNEAIIHRKLSPVDAAKWTIDTFKWPLITGTCTTIFAFLPMLFFITGISGDYIRVIPITVMVVLIASLFVSLFMLPGLSVAFYRVFTPKVHAGGGLVEKVGKWYVNLMDTILNSKVLNVAVMVCSVVAFIMSFGLVTSNKVPIEVFPGSDFPYFVAEISLPEGTSLSETRNLVSPIVEELSAGLNIFNNDENSEKSPLLTEVLESVVFTIGKPSSLVQEPGEISTDSPETLGIAFNLTPKEERSVKSYAIVPVVEQMLKEAVPKFAEVRMLEQSGGPPSGAPVEVRVFTSDLGRLESITKQVEKELLDVPDLLNVRNNLADKTPQLAWKFDRQTLQFYNLTVQGVAQALRTGVNGTTVMTLAEGDEEIDVKARVDWEGNLEWKSPSSLAKISQIPLQTPNSGTISLEDVAEPTLSSQLSAILHRDGTPFAAVRADLPKDITASQKTAEIQAIINNIEVLPGEVVKIGGEAEEGNRLLVEMGQAMGFAVLLILLVLVLQFNSFHQSIFVLFLIPLSLTGVFVGFWLTNLTISFPTMIGIVSLAGIIVNDAIVLVDRFNKFLPDAESYTKALIEAGRSRMQPIFLTSITTVVGMLPLSLSDEVWGGLGFAIVYGMAISTLLCLVLLPSFLQGWRDAGDFRRKMLLKAKVLLQKQEVEPEIVV